MKRIIKTTIAGLIMLIWNISAFAAFEDEGFTARGKAMGGTLFADFDAVNSMSYNPATISMARSIQLYGAWDTPYWGLNDDSSINTVNFNLVVPFWNQFTIPPDPLFTKRAALGISVHRFGLNGLEPDGTTSVEYYHEGIYSLVYGKDLNDVLFRGAKISAGFKASLYDIGVGNSLDVQNNKMFSGTGRMSFGLDLGVTYDFSENIRLGLAYKNLIAPNISILPDGKDILPSEFRIGGNWDIGDILFLKKSILGFGMISYGRDSADNRQPDSSWNLGYEFKQLNDMIAVRAGGVYQAQKVGDEMDLGFTKLKGIFKMTGGLGFSYIINQSHQFNLDYTLEWGMNMGAFQHTIGLSYQFLFPNSAFAYREETRKELEFEELLKQRAQGAKDTNSTTNTVSVPTPSPSTNAAPKASPVKK